MTEFSEFTTSNVELVHGLMEGLVISIYRLNPDIKLMDNYDVQIDHKDILPNSMHMTLDRDTDLVLSNETVPVTLEYLIKYKKSSRVPLKQESTIVLSSETIAKLRNIFGDLKEDEIYRSII